MFTHKSEQNPMEISAMQHLRNLKGSWVFPIHRLDRATSGLLLFAHSPESARTYSEMFAKKLVRKKYLALVRGRVSEDEGSITLPILSKDNGKLQQARTDYKVLCQFESNNRVDRSTSLLLVTPHTGRTHQIRRHLRKLNHPIIGDTTHGDNKVNKNFADAFGLKKLMLSAVGLSFCLGESDDPTEMDFYVYKDETFKNICRTLKGGVFESI